MLILAAQKKHSFPRRQAPASKKKRGVPGPNLGVHFRVHFHYVNGHFPYAAAAQEAAGEQKEKGGPGLGWSENRS